jgi:hypothetical protein
MVTEGIEPSTVALLAQRSNQLSYATYLNTLPLIQSYQVAPIPFSSLIFICSYSSSDALNFALITKLLYRLLNGLAIVWTAWVSSRARKVTTAKTLN